MTNEDKLLKKLKAGVSAVESGGGDMMYNLAGSSATGLYGQLYGADYLQNVPYLKGVSRKQFAENTDLQNKLFEDLYYDKIKDVPGIKRSITDLKEEYPTQSAGLSDDEVGALINFLGRQGTREYFGYALRDKKPLSEVFPKLYGSKAKYKNKTPEQYLTEYREALEGQEFLFGGKKFKDTKFGKGLRDLGVAVANTGAAPLEALLGTDFGIDEKFGYKTGFGKTIGNIGETVGSTVGSLAPAALNTVAPGLGTGIQLAGQAIGGGLESAGVTKDISTDPQSFLGSNLGTTFSMMANMNPGGDTSKLVTQLGNTGIMQGFAGMFLPTPDPTTARYGAKMEGDIEVESGEVIEFEQGGTQSYNPKAPLKPIGDNTVKVMGDQSHEKGGVDIESSKGESKIWSDYSKNPETGNTFAVDKEQLQKKINDAKERAKSSDRITRESAELELRMLQTEDQELFAAQQAMNNNATSSTQAKRGLWANIHAKRARGERMRKKGEKGAPTESQMARAKAQPGLLNINNIGGFGGQYGLGNTGFGVNTAMDNMLNPSLSTPPMNQYTLFNDLYGNGMNTGMGNLQRSFPGQTTNNPNYFPEPTGMQKFLPYLPAAYNIGMGIAGLANTPQLNPEDYMINSDIKSTQINKTANMAPLMQTYATFMNAERNPARRQAYASQMATKFPSLMNQMDMMQGKLDMQAQALNNRFNAMDSRTRLGVENANMQLGAMPYQFINQGITSASNIYGQQQENQQYRNLLKLLS